MLDRNVPTPSVKMGERFTYTSGLVELDVTCKASVGGGGATSVLAQRRLDRDLSQNSAHRKAGFLAGAAAKRLYWLVAN